MPYDHDTGRDLRRLIPLGIASAVCTVLVTNELMSLGEIDRIDGMVGTAAVAYWFLIIMLQGAAMPYLTLLVMVMHDQSLPVPWRLPILLASSALTGALLFWWASPLKGGLCGLITLAGWLYFIRDRLE